MCWFVIYFNVLRLNLWPDKVFNLLVITRLLIRIINLWFICWNKLSFLHKPIQTTSLLCYIPLHVCTTFWSIELTIPIYMLWVILFAIFFIKYNMRLFLILFDRFLSSLNLNNSISLFLMWYSAPSIVLIIHCQLFLRFVSILMKLWGRCWITDSMLLLNCSL